MQGSVLSNTNTYKSAAIRFIQVSVNKLLESDTLQELFYQLTINNTTQQIPLMLERSQDLIHKIRNSLLNQQQSTRDCLEIKTSGGAGGDGQKGYQ